MKFKNGTLTEEERVLLKQLEEEERLRKLRLLEELREKKRRGLLTDDELRLLTELE